MSKLGKLERVRNVTSTWKDEARDFTPWLARPENLAVLSVALGFGDDSFALEAVELAVGAFRADILCRDRESADSDRILIENQFGKSDHDHLGKLITYASGLKARNIVLIGEEIRPEHRAALDWLNSISNDDHRFFACEVELWKIGDSLPAPRFNVVVEPNEWVRQVEKGAAAENSELKQIYVRYWAAFTEVLKENQVLRPKSPKPQQWMTFPIGQAGAHLSAGVSARDRFIRVGLIIQSEDAKLALEKLHAQRDKIHTDLGFAVIWDSKEHAQRIQIRVQLDDTIPTDDKDWPRQHKWLMDHLVAFERVFKPLMSGIRGNEGDE